MTIKGAAYVGSIWAALFLAVGYGLWQTKPKVVQKTAQTDNSTSGTDVSTAEVPPLAFPSTWPAPLAKPEGTPQQVAASLARTVLAGGQDTLPALERAALESGFSIHDKDGKILFSPAPDADNGMSMLDLDLVVAAEGAKRKSFVTYDDLQHQLGTDVDLPLKDLLPTAIIEALNSQHASQQLWANFILQLGMESNGDYDSVGSAGDTRVSGPQACFLLYEAAGQAWSATQPAPEKPANDANPTVPPADSPPPTGNHISHGPLSDTRTQSLNGTARDAAFRDLAQDMSQFSGTAINEYIASHPQSTPHLSMLALEREQLIGTGTTINLKMQGAPLVRSSVTGKEGGSRPLFVFVTFKVSDEVRTRYDAARQFVPRAKALPNNGPQDVTVALPTDPDIIYAKPYSLSTGGAQVQAELIGAEQKRDLPDAPREDNYSAGVYAWVPAENPLVHHTFYVPIKDWLANGLEVSLHIKVEGSGILSYPEHDTKLLWAIDRELADRINLNYDYPQAALTPTLYDPKEPNRFTSYMKLVTDPKKPSPDPSPQYHVDDVFAYDAPAMGGCGKDNERLRSVKTIKSLPWKTQQQPPTGASIAQWDSKNKVYHFSFAYHSVPVEINQDQSTAQQTIMSVVDDIDIPKMIGMIFDTGMVSLPNVQPIGSDPPLKFKVKSLEGGSGPNEVSVSLGWVIQRKGAAGGTGSNPPLTWVEQQEIRDRAESELARLMSLPANAIETPRQTAMGALARSHHGPLWLSDPSAATCSEIEIDDELPQSARQHK